MPELRTVIKLVKLPLCIGLPSHYQVHVGLPHFGEDTAQPSRDVGILLLHGLAVRGLSRAAQKKIRRATQHTKGKVDGTTNTTLRPCMAHATV